MATAQEIKSEDDVLVLTKDNFQDTIKTNEFVLVEFYTPRCRYCQTLAPTFYQVAKHLRDNKSTVKLAKVDGSEEVDLAKEFDVRTYPKLKFFRSAKPMDYSGGGRQFDDIVAWITKKLGPPAKELETFEAAEEFIDANKVLIFGFFKDRKTDAAKAFNAAAYSLDTFVYGMSCSEEVIAKYEAQCDSVVLFKPFDEKKTVFEGDVTEENLKKFIQIHSMPLIVAFNPNNSTLKISGGVIKSHLLFFISKEAGHITKYVEPVKDIAKQFREDVMFVTINSDEDENRRIFTFFDVSKDEAPTVLLIKSEEIDTIKYKPDFKDITPENIKAFVENFLDGKLKPVLLSQELPEDWDKNPVKILVAKNFDEVTLNDKKGVLVKFYDPQCFYSKHLMRIYDRLGEKYKNHESIVIAKMDATENEMEHTKILSLPTFKYYRKGDNQVIDYRLDRTFDNFVKFLESGCSVGQITPKQDEALVADVHKED